MLNFLDALSAEIVIRQTLFGVHIVIALVLSFPISLLIIVAINKLRQANEIDTGYSVIPSILIAIYLFVAMLLAPRWAEDAAEASRAFSKANQIKRLTCLDQAFKADGSFEEKNINALLNEAESMTQKKNKCQLNFEAFENLIGEYEMASVKSRGNGLAAIRDELKRKMAEASR